MTTPILSIIGILLAAASGSMLAYHGGDALESGTARAQTAASVLVVDQVAQAVQLHDLQEGDVYAGPSLDGLVSTSYLKAVPANPTGGSAPTIVDRDGRRAVAMPLAGMKGATCDGVTRLLDRTPSGIAGCDDGSDGPVVYATV